MNTTGKIDALARIRSHAMHAHCAQLAGKKYGGYGDWGILTSNGIDVVDVDARLAVLEVRHWQRACPPRAQLE